MQGMDLSIQGHYPKGEKDRTSSEGREDQVAGSSGDGEEWRRSY